MRERKSPVDQIPKRELFAYRAELKGELFRALRAMFRRLHEEEGLTQAEIARRLNADPGLISRRMRGQQNMRLETLSDLARAMNCRVDVKLTSFKSVQGRAEPERTARLVAGQQGGT